VNCKQRGQVCLLIWLLAASSSAYAKPEKIIEKVKVEDISFRVVVEGNYAKAASTGSAFWAPVGARYYALAKKAIEQVSGCQVVDNNSYRANLYATLDCSVKPIAGG